MFNETLTKTKTRTVLRIPTTRYDLGTARHGIRKQPPSKLHEIYHRGHMQNVVKEELSAFHTLRNTKFAATSHVIRATRQKSIDR